MFAARGDASGKKERPFASVHPLNQTKREHSASRLFRPRFPLCLTGSSWKEATKENGTLINYRAFRTLWNPPADFGSRPLIGAWMLDRRRSFEDSRLFRLSRGRFQLPRASKTLVTILGEPSWSEGEIFGGGRLDHAIFHQPRT